MNWFTRWLGMESADDAGDDGAPGRDMPAADETTSARVLDALGQVVDPELGVDVVNLGLVRRVEADEAGVRVVMTATSPACPVAPMIRAEARAAVEEVLGDRGPVEVVMVWDPPWRPEDMSERARQLLGTDA